MIGQPWAIFAVACLLATLLAGPALGQQILFVNGGDDDVHEAVQSSNGTSVAGRALSAALNRFGVTLDEAPDARAIDAEQLKKHRLLVLAGNGGGADKDALSSDVIDVLLAWVERGGVLFVYHSGIDIQACGRSRDEYARVIGAKATAHGLLGQGLIRVVDAMHPATRSMLMESEVEDRFYTYTDLEADAIHVLATVRVGDDAAYPIIWCRHYGKGKVYYNGLGCTASVWADERFLRGFWDAVKWAVERSPLPKAQTEPNLEKALIKGN